MCSDFDVLSSSWYLEYTEAEYIGEWILAKAVSHHFGLCTKGSISLREDFCNYTILTEPLSKWPNSRPF